MRWLRFILTPAHAAPEQRHEPTPEQLAAHHEAAEMALWQEATTDALLTICQARKGWAGDAA